MGVLVEFEVHPEAAKRFDERAFLLLQKIETKRVLPDSLQPRKAEFVAPVPVYTSLISVEGDELSWYVTIDGIEYGFSGVAYVELVTLAEDVQRTSALREVLSVTFTLDMLKQWMEKGVGDQPDPSATKYILSRLGNAVRSYTVWLPLRSVRIEGSVQFGPVQVATLDRNTIKHWFGWTEEQYEAYRDTGAAPLPMTPQSVEGRACAKTSVRAELSKAIEVGIERAQTAAACLRMMSAGVMFARAVTPCSIFAVGPSAIFDCYVTEDGRMAGGKGESLEDAWIISAAQLAKMKTHFDSLDALLKRGRESSFNDVVIRCVEQFSRAALTREPEDKLVYACSALDSLFLRNPNEAVGQAVCDRIAFLIGHHGSERRQIAGTVKKGYSLRGKYVHHLMAFEETISCNQFLRVGLAAAKCRRTVSIVCDEGAFSGVAR
jgi:hypothetical protein